MVAYLSSLMLQLLTFKFLIEEIISYMLLKVPCSSILTRGVSPRAPPSQSHWRPLTASFIPLSTHTQIYIEIYIDISCVVCPGSSCGLQWKKAGTAGYSLRLVRSFSEHMNTCHRLPGLKGLISSGRRAEYTVRRDLTSC